MYWQKLKALNSWDGLQNMPTFDQMRIVAVCFFRAFKHWQTWLAMIFIAIVAYVSNIAGLALGLKFGIFNLAGLLVAAIGGGIFGIVMTQQAKKHLKEVMKVYTNQEKRP
ncbi:MAG TPA: hypothetical protein ENG87_04675 [Candidatus Pacearchaeota archaeon]|nr:hypothetical protein [Candidatus Pacearchaeota archaeon]